MNLKWLARPLTFAGMILGAIVHSGCDNREAPVPPAQFAVLTSTTKATTASPNSKVATTENDPAPAKPSRSGWRSQIPVNPIIASWAVVPVTVPGDKNPQGQHPTSIAVDEDGSRVIVVGHKAIDVWSRGKSAPTRIPHDWLRGEAVIAPDASRIFVGDTINHKLLTYHGSGRLIHTLPLGEKIGWISLRLNDCLQGHGCSPYAFGTHIHQTSGIYRLDPDKGTISVEQKFGDIRDYTGPSKVVGLENDEYLALIVATQAPDSRESGIYRIHRNGTFQRCNGVELDPALLKHAPSMEASADGRYAAVFGSYDLDIWDLSAAKRVYRFRASESGVNQCKFTTDGRVLIQKGRLSNVLIVGVGMGRGIQGPWEMEMHTLGTNDKPVRFTLDDFGLPHTQFAFSPNSKFLALAGDKAVSVIDVEKAFPKK